MGIIFFITFLITPTLTLAQSEVDEIHASWEIVDQLSLDLPALLELPTARAYCRLDTSTGTSNETACSDPYKFFCDNFNPASAEAQAQAEEMKNEILEVAKTRSDEYRLNWESEYIEKGGDPYFKTSSREDFITSESAQFQTPEGELDINKIKAHWGKYYKRPLSWSELKIPVGPLSNNPIEIAKQVKKNAINRELENFFREHGCENYLEGRDDSPDCYRLFLTLDDPRPQKNFPLLAQHIMSVYFHRNELEFTIPQGQWVGNETVNEYQAFFGLVKSNSEDYLASIGARAHELTASQLVIPDPGQKHATDPTERGASYDPPGAVSMGLPLWRDSSPLESFFILTHELGHGISYQHEGQGIESRTIFKQVRQCLKRHPLLNLKSTEEERFADWFATESFFYFLHNKFPNLNSRQKQALVMASVSKMFCEKLPLAYRFNNYHPVGRYRLNKVFAAHPEFSKIFGCSPEQDKDLSQTYCPLSR